jgi:hypothetical protein
MSVNIIEIVSNSDNSNRANEQLQNIWAFNNDACNIVSKIGEFSFTCPTNPISEKISKLIDNSRENVYISTSNLTDSNILSAIESAISRNIRIYLLIDSSGFKSFLDYEGSAGVKGHILTRERKTRGLDIVLSDWKLASKKGFLLNNPLDGTLSKENGNWCMELDENQVDALRNHSEHEFWSSVQGQELLSPDTEPEAINSRPYTLKTLTNNDFVLREACSLDGNDNNAEKALRNERNWNHFSGGKSLQNSMNGLAIPKSNWGMLGTKSYEMEPEMDITDSQSQDLGVVHLAKMPDSIKELQEFQPALDLPEDSLARECEFKWIAAPPVLPTSASEDGLHKEWKDAKNEISKRLKALDESNVVSKIPGFGRKAKELKKTILELTATVESIDDPKSLSDMIDNVEKLTEAVGGNLDAMKAAEDEEARQKLEDKQRAAHNAAVEKANKTIKDLEPRLKKRKTELDKLKKAVKKAKDVEKSKLESDIETLSPKIKQLDAELSKAKLTRSAKFEFKAPATLSSSKKKGTKPHKFLGDTRNSKLDLSVPKEGLPQFGTLYEAGTERYLAVSDWTHVAQGRKDAKRLKATLCAPREVLK